MDRQNIIFHCKINVENHVVKKNNRPIYKNKATGKVFLGKSTRLVSAENNLIMELRRAWFNSPDFPKTPIEYPINVKMIFWFNDKEFFTKKGKISKHIPDLSNLYQLVEDCMQKASIIENDHWISGHDGSRRKPTLDHSYLEITISPI